LQQRINLCPLNKSIKKIAGADVSYSIKNETFFAAVVVLSYPDLQEVESATAVDSVTFPYIPGYLTFREAPILLEAFKKIINIPDAVMFDGQGIAHPRSLGIATHLGLILNIPAIGCAKSRLVGTHEIVPQNHGEYKPLLHNGRMIGAVVRTRTGVKPVYVSPGHKITMHESIKMVLNTTIKFRLPEPTRRAHILVNHVRKVHN